MNAYHQVKDDNNLSQKWILIHRLTKIHLILSMPDKIIQTQSGKYEREYCCLLKDKVLPDISMDNM